jgi:hypothetical protein
MSRPSIRQLDLALPRRHGGRRPRAGRPPRNPLRPSERHKIRPFHDHRQPVHVTARIASGLPSLREPRLAEVIEQTLRDRLARGRVRVVHYSIQFDHLHLIVEAKDRTRLFRGLQGHFVSLARRVNRVLGRRGRVFADRYHARALSNPTQTRRCIGYVLRNWTKHLHRQGIDPRSSAPWLPWIMPRPEKSSPVSQPTTWLLRMGWRYG